MEYPRLVYKSASEHLHCADAEQREAALATGWFDSVPEAKLKKHLPRTDISVTVYKGEESYKAKDQAEADLFIGADGWFATKQEAAAAALKAEWPATPADVDAIMGGLEGKKNKAELTAYAARIGATVDASAKAGEMLAAIRARLEAGSDAK